MANIQDGDRLYVRTVVGLPYEFLVGDSGSGAVALNDVIGDPNTQWVARLASNRVWTLECQDNTGLLRYLDSDAAMHVNMDDDPTDASTHWQFVQTSTPGHWQIQSRQHGHFLRAGERFPTVTTDGTTHLTRWELLLIAQ